MRDAADDRNYLAISEFLLRAVGPEFHRSSSPFGLGNRRAVEIAHGILTRDGDVRGAGGEQHLATLRQSAIRMVEFGRSYILTAERGFVRKWLLLTLLFGYR